jgi:hypothetical protein
MVKEVFDSTLLEVLEKEESVSFADPKTGQCRFPLGTINEPPVRFCGAPTVVGAIYCKDCMRIAYRRVERR